MLRTRAGRMAFLTAERHPAPTPTDGVSTRASSPSEGTREEEGMDISFHEAEDLLYAGDDVEDAGYQASDFGPGEIELSGGDDPKTPDETGGVESEDETRPKEEAEADTEDDDQGDGPLSLGSRGRARRPTGPRGPRRRKPTGMFTSLDIYSTYALH